MICQSIQKRIINATQASKILRVEEIQPLWNHYGVLSRIHLQDSSYPSVILKHIQIPQNQSHPKGFGTSIARQRKIKSYQVEQSWYQTYNPILSEHTSCRTPKCIDSFRLNDEIFLLLEDLTVSGFYPHHHAPEWKDLQAVLKWLASFHAFFLQHPTQELWETGTYWHLATRPDELKQLQGSDLHWIASFIDARLQSASFQTCVHGDAKLANFCFHKINNEVAAVDFQYSGQGCGMKDLAYFVGSIFGEEECELYEEQILSLYFDFLQSALKDSSIDVFELEKEWRALYPVCWADFQRFLLGWSPQHSKHTQYTQKVTDQVVQAIIEELFQSALNACREAGEYILSRWKSDLEIQSKGYESRANDVVTEVDLQAQDIILKHLSPSMHTYQIGLLTEEREDDQSRLEKHAFWAVDPLDGTRYFADGMEGFAVSVALVSREGKSLIGVVYDPVKDHLYHAIKGQGFYQNGVLWDELHVKSIQGDPEPKSIQGDQESKSTALSQAGQSLTRYADLSLRDRPDFETLNAQYTIKHCGGAVLNIIQVIKQPSSFYAKRVRSSLGGCAIWDVAAVDLMLSERGGKATFLDGSELQLNRSESCYFNDVGLLFWNDLPGKDQGETLF